MNATTRRIYAHQIIVALHAQVRGNVAYWPLTAAPGAARRGRYWVKTGHGSSCRARRFMTRRDAVRPPIIALRDVYSIA